MPQSSSTIMTLTEELFPAIAELMLMQETRQQVLSPQLAPLRSRQQIYTQLTAHLQSNQPSLVVQDAYGRIRGYAHPDLWQLAPDSLFHAFLSPSNGIARGLTLPDPISKDAYDITALLLMQLEHLWRQLGATGDLISWPESDGCLAPLLIAQGFHLEGFYALRSPEEPNITLVESRLNIRPAQPEDEEAILHLFWQELAFHEAHVHYARINSAALRGFQQVLQHYYRAPSSNMRRQILVAEWQHEVIAMLVSRSLDITMDDEPAWARPGHYINIEHVSVRAERHNQGIGHQLVQALLSIPQAQAIDGYLTWYSYENRQATSFWQRQGFQPLWSTYQRREIE